MDNNIRVERAKKRISQKELAEGVGIHASHMNLIENNKINPKLSLAMRIARFFGMETEELFYE